MILNDVGEVVLTWTKCGTGREQDLLIHLSSMEWKNSTRDFPAFIENRKCEELNQIPLSQQQLIYLFQWRQSFATGLF